MSPPARSAGWAGSILILADYTADPYSVQMLTTVAGAALLVIPGVAGVNLSGLGSARGYGYAATVKAELARRIREEHGT